MGTPDFAVAALQRLLDNPLYEVIAVYTRAPQPAGRGQQLRFSPVHQLAENAGIPVYTPKSLKRDPAAVAEFAALKSDIAVVAAYGLILPKTVLDAPRLGCLNIHASLLPRWRGAAPIQRAIEAGDTESGVTIMQMEEGLDTGPMLRKGKVPIHAGTTGQSLHDELAALGADLIDDVLKDIVAGHSPVPERQDDSLSNYAPMLRKEEGHINWTEDAAVIDRRIRAFTPWPGCFALGPDGKRFKILGGEFIPENAKNPPGTLLSAQGDIACGKSLYRVTLIQPENSKPMDVKSALNGHRMTLNMVLA